MRLTEGQNRVLGQLQARWERLEPGGSRLIVVMGGPGTGKTAIVHAFYQWLVAEAAAIHPDLPLFWPAQMGGDHQPKEQVRKLTRPEAPADGTGHLPFAWLGQRCGNRPISHAEVAAWVPAEMVEALPIHRRPNATGTGDDAPAAGLGDEAVMRLLAFVSAGGGELAPTGPGEVAGGPAPWTTWGEGSARLARTVTAEDARWRLNAETVGRFPWTPIPPRRRTLLDRLGRLAALGVPAVMFLEDAHMAQESALEVCRSAMASPATRLLVLATADTGPLVSQMSGREGFGSLLVANPGSRRRPVALALENPPATEVARIVCEATSTAGHDVQERIIEASGGNLAAAVAVALARQVVAGSGPLPQAGMAARPPTMAERWQEFPLMLRRYLAATAALQGPMWYADQPLDQLSDLSRNAQERAAKLARAEGIVVPVDRWRHGFVDDEWHGFARDRVARVLPLAQLDACRRDLFDSISCDKHDPTLWPGLPVAVQVTILRSHTDLLADPTPEQLVELGDELLDSLDRLAGLQAATDEMAEATRTAARAAVLVGLIRHAGGVVDPSRVAQVQGRHTYLRLAGRHPADAMAAAQEAAARTEAGHGDPNADLVIAGWDVACRHAEGGDLGRAASLGREMLAAATDAVALETILSWRSQQAEWAGGAGHTDEAVEALAALVPALERRAGPDHLTTLAARHRLANWLGVAGRAGQAAEQYGGLAADLGRVLGPDHADTLAIRHHLARWLGESGQPSEAADHYQVLVTDLVRVMGPDHRDTLATRHHLAHWLGESGRAGQAAEHYQALATDLGRVLGPDHPDTLATRHNLAHWLGQRGRADQAVEHYRALLPDVERVLGADHPEAVATQAHLARWQAETGAVNRPE